MSSVRTAAALVGIYIPSDPGTALTLAGAGIGFAVGGPEGARWGAIVGGTVGGMLKSGPTIDGPKLSDLTVMHSADGVAIPVVFGAVRIAGNVLQSTPKRQSSKSSGGGGGKGGGGSPRVTTYSYDVDCAIGICAGPIAGIRRIWANGNLIADYTPQASAGALLAGGKVASSIKIYLGTEDQLPDPTLETLSGIGVTPAYRGQAYAVFTGLQLERFGNSLPNFTFEVVAAGNTSPYRRLMLATIPQQWSTGSVSGLGRATIFSLSDVVRLGVAGDGADSSVYVYDLEGNFLGRETRQAEEAQWPPLQAGSYPDIYWGMGRLWNGDALCYRFYYGRVIGAGETLVTGGAYGIRKDASGGLPAGRVLFTSCMSADGRYILSVTAPAGSTPGDSQGDRWHVTEWDGAAARLVKEGLVESPFGGYEFGPGNAAVGHLHAGMMESNLEYIWDAYGAGGGEVTLYRIGADGVLRVEKRFSGAGSEGVPTDSYPSVFADAGICVTVIGNRIAVHTRLPALESNAVPVASVITALCQRAGLGPEYLDVSEISDSLHGYAIGVQTSARAALDQLRIYAPYDVVEVDGVLRFVPRGQVISSEIPWGDLAASESKSTADPVAITAADDAELPTVVTVVYPDPAADYQTASQTARRNRSGVSGQVWAMSPAINQTRLELPIAMPGDRAARIAATLLWDTVTGSRRAQFAVGIKYSGLRVSDVVRVLGSDASYVLRIVSITDAGLIRKVDAVFEDSAIYVSSPPPAELIGVPEQSITPAGLTRMQLLDIPLVRDTDDGPGFYVAAGRYLPGWPGATVYASADAGQTWDEVQTFANPATLGATEDVLPAWPGGNTFDESSRVTVRVTPGLQLASIAQSAVFNGGNAALIGSEIIQFRSAELIGANLYRLSGLLRGRRGTEWAMGTHAPGDRFVLLAGVAGLARIVSAAADVGALRRYKAITAGDSLDSAPAVDFVDTGASLKPYAPVHINAGRDGGGNIVITWVRRTRIDGDWRDYADAGLGESLETYEVDIISAGGAVLRTLTATAPSVVYSADLCLIDFGAMITSLTIRVYQMSAVVGRGTGAEAVLSLSPFSRIVDPFFAGLEPAAGARAAVPLCSSGNKMVMVTLGIKKVGPTGYMCRRFFRTSSGATFEQTGTDVLTTPLSTGNEYPDNALSAMAPSGDWLGFGAIASSTREFCYASFATAPVGKGPSFASTDAPLSIAYYSGEWYCATKSGAWYKTTDGTAWTLLGSLPAVGPVYRTTAGWLQIRGQQTAENPNVFDPEIHFTSAANALSGWGRTLSARDVTGNTLGGIPYRPYVAGNVVYVDVLGYEYTSGLSTEKSMILRSTNGGISWLVDMSISGSTVGAWPGAFVPASRGPIHIMSGGVFRISPLASSAAQWGQSLRRYGPNDWRIVATTGLTTYAENDADLCGDGFSLVCGGFRRSPVPRVSTDGISFKDPLVILA